MSRIGKQPINIPDGVEVKIKDSLIKIKGPKGELTQEILPGIKVEVKDSDTEGIRKIIVSLEKKTKDSAAFWGLLRTLISNMIEGVIEGYQKQLEVEGVGYRVVLEGNKLVLSLGFSHSVEVTAPQGIEFKVEKNLITVSGIDKQLVGQVAANIRAKKKPEPYKGKGIHYLGEVIRRKAGKKAAGTE